MKKELDKMRAEKKERAATLKEEQGLDKFQVATARFIDTLYGHLSGNHPVTSIDNARATCELMNGLTNHLKKSGLLSPDTSLIYSRKNSTDEEPSVKTRLTDEMYQNSRKRSNFAKHADRDANSTLSYDATFDTNHLLFNMAYDYETLHCALMKQGLIDSANEKLYPIERSFLNDHHGYRKIYYPEYDVPNRGAASGDSAVDLMIRFQRLTELDREKKECLVPAGTAVCAIFRRADNLPLTAEGGAQKIKQLGIWPVDTQANASMVRDITSHPKNNHDN